MTLFSIGIRDDGEVLTIQKAPHQGDDCDGLVYSARDEEGHDVFLFFISAFSQGEAVITAREMFDGGEYVALDPIWQPGSMWPDTADNWLSDQAVVQIYSPNMRRGYITIVPTHKRTDPFIDHFGEKITWTYKREIEARFANELTESNERWKRMKEKIQLSEVPTEREAVAEPVREVKQLSFDFG